MDSKELHAFIKVYECRSIHLAAKSLFITSQGLGKTISRLETELGVPLFQRTSSGVIPTQYADRIYSHARIIEDQFSAIEHVDRNTGKEITIGFTNGLYRILTLQFFNDFRAVHPEILVHPYDSTDNVLEQRLRNDEFNLCFLSAPVDLTRYNAIAFITVGLCFLTNANNPLSLKDQISPEDLADEPIVISNRDYSVYSVRSNELSISGISNNHLIETMDSDFHVMSVSQGYASTLMIDLPEFIGNYPDVVRIPLKDPSRYEWSVMACYKKNKDLTDDEKIFLRFSMNWIRKYRPKLVKHGT